MTLHMPRGGMNKSLRYYLAGPMSGYPDFNYPTFERAKARLESHGLIIESPHLNPWPEGTVGRRAEDVVIDGEQLWQFMMRSALKQLLTCQAIILMKGWTESRGAVLEANIASALRIPMYFLDGDDLVAMHNELEK